MSDATPTSRFVEFRDGTRVLIDDIASVSEGLRALADLDAAVIAIEAQLDGSAVRVDHEWAVRARTALKHRKRARSHLESRISTLRRAEHVATVQAQEVVYRARIDERRRAFILAAREVLDPETLARIWARAAAAAPQAFVDGPITDVAHGMGGMSLAQARESGRVPAAGGSR